MSIVRLQSWLADVVASPRQHAGALIGLAVAVLVFVVLNVSWLLQPMLVAGIWLLAIGAVVYAAVRLALRHGSLR